MSKTDVLLMLSSRVLVMAASAVFGAIFALSSPETQRALCAAVQSVQP